MSWRNLVISLSHHQGFQSRVYGFKSCDIGNSTVHVKSMLNNVQRLKRCLLVFVLNLPYRRIPLMEFLDVVQFHRLFLNCHWHSSTEVFIRARKVEMSFIIGLDLQKSAVLWKKTRTTAFSYTRYLGLVAMTSRVTCALMIKGSICLVIY